MGRRKEKIKQLKQQEIKRRKYIVIGASAAALLVIAAVVRFVVLPPEGRQTAGGAAAANFMQIAADPNGDLRVPIDSLQSSLNYISYGGREELLLWKDRNGVIKSAFDTCEECYSRGSVRFTLSGSTLTCSVCRSTQPVSALGEESWGGCRPVSVTPAMRADTEAEVVFPSELLAYAGHVFSHWSGSDFSVSIATYGTGEAHSHE